MLDPRWLMTWWRYYGSDHSLLVGLFYEGDTLVGLAPFCRRFRYRGVIPFRRREFLGASEGESDGVWSEYLNLIVRRGYETAVAKAFVRELRAATFGNWDECVLEMMNGENSIVSRLADEFAQHGYWVERTTTVSAPYMVLPADWDSYLDAISKSRRRWFQRTMRDFTAWASDKGYALQRATDAGSLRTGNASR
jgi:hypothetical protein